MKKVLFTLLITVFAIKIVNAQIAQSVFFEIGGPGLASFNYDTRFTKKQDGLGMRAGIGGFKVDRTSVTAFPIGLNYLLGNNTTSFFEVGANVTFVSSKQTSYSNNSSSTFTSTFGTLNFGYRSQPKANGFTFRAAINPIIAEGEVFPFYIGLSFGYKF